MIPLYQDHDGNLLLTKSYCAYFDILGFSEKINKNDIDFFNNYLNILGDILNYIDNVHDLSGKKGFKKYELKIFTDNFILGQPWNDEFGEVELGNIFEALSFIQFEFAKAGIFVRGAVSMSDLYMDENIVLGPALIESYKLESEKAIYPRIILSEEVGQTLVKHINYYSDKSNAQQSNEYLIDVDGFYFINYLYIIIGNRNYPNSEENLVLEEVIAHKNSVLKHLTEFRSNFKLFDKYSWVARYHNYFCDNFVLPKFPQVSQNIIKIEEEKFSSSFRRVI